MESNPTVKLLQGISRAEPLVIIRFRAFSVLQERRSRMAGWVLPYPKSRSSKSSSFITAISRCLQNMLTNGS